MNLYSTGVMLALGILLVDQKDKPDDWVWTLKFIFMMLLSWVTVGLFIAYHLKGAK